MIRGKVIAIPATAFFDALKETRARVANRERLGKIGANAVANRIKGHFRELNQRPSKNGGKKSNFWSQIRDSVQVLASGEGAVVQINDPRFNLKYFGGVVTPKTAKALAIPLAPEFEGVLPSTFPRNRFFYLKSEKGDNLGILAEHLGGGQIRAAYLLRKRTTHAPQADALPPLDELRSIAVEAITRAIMRG